MLFLCSSMNSAAESYGANLNLTFAYLEAGIPMEYSRTNLNRYYHILKNTNEEFSVFFCDTDMHYNYLTHELFPQYGAVDYYDYSNEGIERVAKKFFSNSPMLTVTREVDELTAYLIGRTETLSLKSGLFLAATVGRR